MSRKRKAKYFDQHISKYTPTEKVAPENLMKSIIPVTGKSSDGKTIAMFPEVSVTNTLTESDMDSLLEKAPKVTPTKPELLYMASFLKAIKSRFMFMWHKVGKINELAWAAKQRAEEAFELGGANAKESWCTRLEIDSMNSKIDAINEALSSWGLDVREFESQISRDIPPEPEDDEKEDDDNYNLSGEVAAQIVKETTASGKKSIAELKKEVNQIIAKDREMEAEKELVSKAIQKFESKGSDGADRKPAPPKTDKWAGKVVTYKWCDKCRYSAPTAEGTSKAVKCKLAASKYCGEIIYGSRQCSFYRGIDEISSASVDGYDFSDGKVANA